jgi:hypothetical protein
MVGEDRDDGALGSVATQFATEPLGHRTARRPVIGPTVAGSSMVRVATTLSRLNRFFLQVKSHHTVHARSRRFSRIVPKTCVDVSHAANAIPLNGDCSTHVTRCFGVRYIGDYRKPPASLQQTEAFLHHICGTPSFFPGKFARFDSQSRFDQHFCGIRLRRKPNSSSLTSKSPIISNLS